MFHVGAKSALLQCLFMPTAKKTSSARSLAPPLQIEPTSLGFDLVKQGCFSNCKVEKQPFSFSLTTDIT